jgi:hypothetical protein
MTEELELESTLYQRARKHRDQFPGGDGDHYAGRYKALKTTFQNDYQQYVDAALALGEGMLFTSHGVNHFRTVIQRASRIVKFDLTSLNGYELYLLLISIHLHDIGNLFGRRRHEKECKRIIDELGSLLTDNSFEKRLFYEIASAHGGTIGLNKDTIRPLKSVTTFLGQTIHERKLAAILRLADELADDFTRVSAALLKLGIANSVYHYYAKGLQTVEIRPEQARVELHFSFERSVLVKQLPKDAGRKVWLLDELLTRCLKTFSEMRYASQYMRTINFDELHVNVEWAQGGFHVPLKTVSFTFDSLGFPSVTEADIYELIPSLKKYGDIGKLTGKNLCNHIIGKRRGKK